MKQRKIKSYIATIFVATMIMGCNNSTVEREKVGYLVTPTDSNIHYKCGDIKASLNTNGKFHCTSFPISFYTNNDELGSISSIHKDGFVFPQDMEIQPTVKIKFLRVASSQ